MVINAEVTATRLRCRADEMEQAGYPVLSAMLRKVASTLIASSVTDEKAPAYTRHNPWNVISEC